VLRAALGGDSPTHDVASFRIDVVLAGQTCSDTPVATTIVPLQPEPLSLAPLFPKIDGGEHPFADALFVLSPDLYVVCGTPLQQTGEPSQECAPTGETGALVTPGATTEILLVSQCTGANNGAVDSIAILNDPPVIDSLDIVPSKFITACEQATLAVQVSDPDNDPLATVFQVAAPDGTSTTTMGTQLLFSPNGLTGDFQVTVSVVDPFNAQSSLEVTMHVSACDMDSGAGGG
jgi:hypothetical protein